MATWWVSEAIPLAATSLLPLALFPLLGLGSAQESATPYANHLVYLFLGGFMLAQTMQRWNLHRRMALTIVHRVGTSPSRLVLGFMCAAAFISMWVSNTATAAMMMMPIGLAVIQQAVEAVEAEGCGIDTRPGHFHFGASVMLGIAYGASIGGVATIIGTPPNVFLAGTMSAIHGIELLREMARLRDSVGPVVLAVDLALAHQGRVSVGDPVHTRRRLSYSGRARQTQQAQQARRDDDTRKASRRRLRRHRVRVDVPPVVDRVDSNGELRHRLHDRDDGDGGAFPQPGVGRRPASNLRPIAAAAFHRHRDRSDRDADRVRFQHCLGGHVDPDSRRSFSRSRRRSRLRARSCFPPRRRRTRSRSAPVTSPCRNS